MSHQVAPFRELEIAHAANEILLARVRFQMLPQVALSGKFAIAHVASEILRFVVDFQVLH